MQNFNNITLKIKLTSESLCEHYTVTMGQFYPILKTISHKFNIWFHSVIHLENLSNMPQFSLCDVPSCSVVFFDPEDISDRLKNLDGNKSIGPDAVNPYVLKQCYSSFSLPLSLLFQKSYNDGIVPSSGNWLISLQYIKVEVDCLLIIIVGYLDYLFFVKSWFRAAFIHYYESSRIYGHYNRCFK